MIEIINKLWRVHLVSDLGGHEPEWHYAGSPLIDGDTLIVTPGGKNIAAALDKATGKVIWLGGGAEAVSYSTPAPAQLAGRKQYLIFAANHLVGVDAQKGDRLWAIPWKTSWDVNAPVPIPIDNSVFITTGYGHGCALVEVSATGAAIKYQNKELVSRISTPVLHQGFAYCTGESGKLVCLDPKTGQVKWSQPGFEWGGVVAVNGALIAVDGKSGALKLVAMSPDGYKELSSMKGPLTGQHWTAPVVADGRLVIRNTKSLACVDLR
jgi:outer membrane protein assembly factor BamB